MARTPQSRCRVILRHADMGRLMMRLRDIDRALAQRGILPALRIGTELRLRRVATRR